MTLQKLLHPVPSSPVPRRRLVFPVSANARSFQYASTSMKGPVFDQTPVEACKAKLVQNGIPCQIRDLREVGTLDQTVLLEATVSLGTMLKLL